MSPRRRVRLVLIVAVFQVFAAVSAFQLSSVGHFASDLLQLLVEGRHHHDADDDEDQPGHECPAGCPNCHHVHAGGASLPRASCAVLSLPLPAVASRRPFALNDAPTDPSPTSLYRPPRV